MKLHLKRILPLVLSSVMVLASGCGGLAVPAKEDPLSEEEDLARAEEDAAAAEEKDSGEDKTGETPAQETMEAEKEETAALPEGTYPWLVISTVYDSEYKENMGQAITLEYDQADLAGASAEAWPGLAEALSAMNKADADRMQADYEEYRQAALDDAETGKEGYCYAFENKYDIARADASVVSIRRHYYRFAGGFHGYEVTDAVSFDVETGKELGLSDIVKEPDDLPGLLVTRIREKNEETEIGLLSPDTLEEDVKALYEEGSLHWSLDPDGLTFYFAPYSLTSYAEGELQIKLPFTEEDLFLEAYAETPDRYALSFPENYRILVDPDGDGTCQSLALYGERDQYSTISELEILLDGETFRFEVDAYRFHPFLLHTKEGGDWLYVVLSGDNDYQTLEIFSLADGKAVYLDTLPAGLTYIYDNERSLTGVHMITDPSCFELSVRGGDISSYSMSRLYHLGEDGMPAAETDYFRVNSTGYQFKVLQAFKASRIDPVSREILEESVTVSEGTLLTLVYSNNSSWVELSGEDGSLYRVEIDASEWPRTIDGVDISDIFEGLIFAG